MEIPDSCKYFYKHGRLLVIIQMPADPSLANKYRVGHTPESIAAMRPKRQRQQAMASPSNSNYTRPSIEIVYGVGNNDFGITHQ